ncbi:MAG: alpha/beta hydrolase [Clostridia bacterium]|nr:alpha/beta hydrolase [Clostridia bacterium]MBQ8971514.1 alpha/beta hydrolase [Clostridia bacterium]
MKRYLDAKQDERVLSLLGGIPYKVVPHWYNATVRPLYLDLILPKQVENRHDLPVIIWFCGGAFSVMDREVWLPTLIDYAKTGYAVACVDYRTSPQYPFPAPVEDAKAAIRWLRAHAGEYGLDPEHFVAMGESAGGYLACMAALGGSEFDVGENLDQSSSIQGVVNYYGKVDYALCEQYKGSDRRAIEDFLGGNSDPTLPERMSCRNLVDRESPPMLIIHGDADPLVPLSESEALYEALQRCGVRSELCILKGAGHGEDVFYQPPIRRIILDFLAEVLH